MRFGMWEPSKGRAILRRVWGNGICGLTQACLEVVADNPTCRATDNGPISVQVGWREPLAVQDLSIRLGHCGFAEIRDEHMGAPW